MRLGYRARFFLYSLGVIAITGGFAHLYSSSLLREFVVERTARELADRAAFVAETVQAIPDGERPEAALAAMAAAAKGHVAVWDREGRAVSGADPSATLPAWIRQDAESRTDVREVRAASNSSYVSVTRAIRRNGSILYFVRADGVAEPSRSEASDLRQATFLFALAAIGVAVVLTGLGAFRTHRAAGFLTDAARRMAKGFLETRTPSVARAEFAELGQSLDQLAESLSRSLKELKLERDLMGGMLTGMQEGVLLLDHDGRIAMVNPALRDMLLLSGDSIGRSPIEVIRNADLKELLDRARNAGGAATTGEVELSGIKPRRLLVRAGGLQDDPAGLLAVFVDVTEIRRLEVIRRDFVANVSHELRTPVTAIRSAAETVRGAAASDPVASARFLDIIERNAERLHHLVEDLLDLSRIESKEFRLDKEDVDLRTFVPTALSLLRERAENKRIRLTISVPENMPHASVDRRALEQVVLNLVDNAVKYCPEGSGVVVRATLEGQMIRVDIADTGPGIDAKHLPRLFERFYRADAGRSRELGGTGLGLSIVKHLVEASGGRVRVESVVGRGTTFSLTVPAVSGSDEPLAASA
ncbi:MAG: ATP-binding protein [Polyangiaceae bacterium]